MDLFKNIICKIKTQIENVRKFLSGLNHYIELHGLTHITNENRHWTERLIWIVIIPISFFVTFSVCSIQWQRYLANPSVISLERDYRYWRGIMPAITLCFEIKVDPIRAEEYILKNWDIKRDNEEYDYFLEFVETIANASSEDLINFANFAEDDRLENVDMLALVRAVHPTNIYEITSFDNTRKIQFEEVITEKGLCLSVNSPTSVSISSKNNENIFNETDILSCFFIKSQCFVKVDVFNGTLTVSWFKGSIIYLI